MRKISYHLRKAFGSEYQQPTEYKPNTPEHNKNLAEYVKRLNEKKILYTPNYQELKKAFFDSYKYYANKPYDTTRNMEQVDTLLKYFSKDKSFEKDGQYFSLNKGIMLVGGFGTGKTSVIRSIKDCGFSGINFGFNSTIAILDMFNSGDAGCIKRFSRYGDFYFDDFGSEDLAKYNTNIMKHIIENRYFFMTKNLVKTHASTNLTHEEISEKYGYRVASRILEMFNIIKFTGDDYRRKI